MRKAFAVVWTVMLASACAPSATEIERRPVMSTSNATTATTSNSRSPSEAQLQTASEQRAGAPATASPSTRGPIREVTIVGDPLIPPELLSPPLHNPALRSPMPGGYLGGWYGDTGIDIAGKYLPVYAIAAGTLEYSERGHTLWTGKGDTPYSVRIRLDDPIPYNGHRVTHVYYTHLSKLVTEQPEGSETPKHVVAGERIADSGIGNGVAHLHLGLLLDDQVEQDSWTYILREGDIRKIMGNYRTVELLPKK